VLPPSYKGAETCTVTLAEAANGTWTLRGFADGVSAELDAGGNLPRIAPGRFGLDLGWSLDAWRAGLGAVRYRSQDDVADGETATDGFTLVNAQVAYHWDTQTFGWEAYLQGSNLTDEEARLHTSFLKDVAPLMGRNLSAGLRVFF
jgi:iron complex outermembrane receptor protein